MIKSDTKTTRAETIGKRYMLGALSVGLVPFPLVDMGILAGIQLKMLHSLAKLYGVKFSSEVGKAFIASVLGGGTTFVLSSSVARLAVKSLPAYGWAACLIGTSVFGGASTYAIGKVFIQHFESGGTFLTFDPRKVKGYYAQQYEEGKEEVRKSFIGVKP
ncbi:MAG: YcjF family protein [Methylococcales bacterium]